MKRKTALMLTLLTLPFFVEPSAAQYGNTPPLHVSGNQLKDPNGNTVVLHGVMDTPSPYFNSYRWGNECSTSTVSACRTYFRKLFTAMTDTTQGAWANLFRLHLDPCWTNDPKKTSDGKESGEADISRFSETRLKTFLKTLYFQIAKDAVGKGMYVILRPPGVFPGTVQVGDYYNEYLTKVWDIVTQNDSIKKYSGQISIELGNEPVTVLDADGKENVNALHDFFQPIVDKIRENGYTGIIWVPGSGWQSNYKNYAINPITGYNIGYAVHNYVGWYGADDSVNPKDSLTYIKKFKESVPVLDTNPIVITEVDWSPYKEGTGHYNEHNEWVESNYGTWATGSTSRWGTVYKSILDHYGNISMTLSGTGCYIDIDTYLNSKKVVPAFDGLEEACGAATFQWYKEYAQVNYPVPDATGTWSVYDRTVTDIVMDEREIQLTSGSSQAINIIATYGSGITENVAAACTYKVSNPSVATVEDGKIVSSMDGETDITATYTDSDGKSVSIDFTVKVSTFPLTADGINPSIYGSGSFKESTGALTTSQYGFGGWQYTNGVDLSGARYLVVQLRTSSTCNPSFRLYDENNYWTTPYMYDVGTRRSIKIDLQNMTKSDGTLCDPSHIYIAGFWTTGGTVYIKNVFLSDDGSTPVGIEEIEEDAVANDAEVLYTEYYTPDGTLAIAPQKGINIVRQTLRNGSVRCYKLQVR
jgi:hypothetical protein